MGPILDSLNIPNVNQRPFNWDPFTGIGLKNNLEVEEELENFVEIGQIADNDDRLLSQITLKMWQKSIQYFENDKDNNQQELKPTGNINKVIDEFLDDFENEN